MCAYVNVCACVYECKCVRVGMFVRRSRHECIALEECLTELVGHVCKLPTEMKCESYEKEGL